MRFVLEEEEDQGNGLQDLEVYLVLVEAVKVEPMWETLSLFDLLMVQSILVAEAVELETTELLEALMMVH